MSTMNGSNTTALPPEARLRGRGNGRIRPGNLSDVAKDGFVHLKPRTPRTHDISHTGSHVPSIEDVAADINNAVQAVWPRRHELKYTRAHVLLLSWEDDDLGVAMGIKDLRHVFEKRYKFEVEEHGIPSEKPIKNVQQRIYSLLELDGKDTLFVVYYAGHGMQSNEGPIWFANRDDPTIAIPSGGVQSLLEEADADVLLFYDCCHSASTPTCPLQLSKGGVTECIAACGFGDKAAEVDEHSFTKALIKTLVLGSKQPPFTVSELHSQVLSHLKCSPPELARDRDGNHTGFLEPQRRKTPIYSTLSKTKPHRSILLGPLPSPAKQSTTAGNSPDSSSAGSATSTPSSSSGESPSKKRKKTITDRDTYAQVLVIARVDHTNLDPEEWVNWIREMPSNGKSVHIEGRWDSFSTLLLLRMPVAVWNLLPDNEAYDFAGFVTSDNMIASQAQVHPLKISCSCENNNPATTSPQDGIRDRTNSNHVHQDIQMSNSTAEPRTIATPPSLVLGNEETERGAGEKHSAPNLSPDRLAALSLGPDTLSTQLNQRSVTKDELLALGAYRASTTVFRHLSSQAKIARPIRLPSFGYATTAEEALDSDSIGGSTLAEIEQEETDEAKVEENNPSSWPSSFVEEYPSKTPVSVLPKEPQKKINRMNTPLLPETSRRSHKSSRSARSRYGSSRTAGYQYIWIWSCCACRDYNGNYTSGGMSTEIDGCPNCSQTRCSDCKLEEVKARLA